MNMNKKIVFAALVALPLAVFAALPDELVVADGESRPCGVDVRNFVLRGEVFSERDAEATLTFHTDGRGAGYEVLFRNGAIDGTRKTGSLSHIRNLYRSLAKDGEWFSFEVAVRGQTVEVRVGGQTVVRYVEPLNPWRLPAHAAQRLGRGDIIFSGRSGTTRFRNLVMQTLADGATALQKEPMVAPVDEQTDRAIRLQQIDFPVIDYHVHLKGGLTRDLALAKSFAYGINYGIAPNIGEGGVGEMYSTDESALAYLNALRPYPFLCAAQGEGRRWALNFRPETFAAFDYIFTDAMTIVEKGHPLRIYRADEFRLDGRTKDEWMDFLVDQTVKILENEPADIYANATYLPEEMQADYEHYWTDARVNRVLDVLKKNGIALEISARYKIPSARIVQMAKARGIKFTFGTNNADSNFGRLEYALDTAVACGLTADDLWFPSMSTRAQRKASAWNSFATSRLAPVR